MVGLGLTARSIAGDPYWRTSIDFGLYLRSAKELAAGHSAYPPNNPGGLYFGVPAHDGYAYPPVLAWIVAALLPLGDVGVRAVATVASVGTLGWSIVSMLRGRLAWQWIVLALGLVAFSRFFRVEAYHGQVNWILLALIVLGAQTYERSPKRTALLWGATIAVKPFLLVLPAWLAWRRRYREAALSAGFGVALVALSFAASPESWAGFRESMAYYSSAMGAGGRPDNYALHGLWLRLFEANPYATPWAVVPGLPVALTAASGLALAALFAVAFPRDGEQSPPQILLELGSVALIACALGPLSNGSHLWLALPGLVGSWLVARERGGRWRFVFWGWAALFALRLSPVRMPWTPNGLEWVAPSGLGVLFTGAHAVTMVSLVALATWATLRRREARAVELVRAA